MPSSNDLTERLPPASASIRPGARVRNSPRSLPALPWLLLLLPLLLVSALAAGAVVPMPSAEAPSVSAAKRDADSARNGKKKPRPATCFGAAATIADRRGEIDGTDQADVIIGDNKANEVTSLRGDDRLCGRGGNDRIRPFISNIEDTYQANGGAGNDDIDDGAGNDLLLGGPGNDRLDGGSNADRLEGGPGDDEILAVDSALSSIPPALDTVLGGGGDDVIRAADGFRDVIDCGAGRDRVTFDADLDEITNCERRTPVAPDASRAGADPARPAAADPEDASGDRPKKEDRG
jgi:hypothetical protein